MVGEGGNGHVGTNCNSVVLNSVNRHASSCR